MKEKEREQEDLSTQMQQVVGRKDYPCHTPFIVSIDSTATSTRSRVHDMVEHWRKE